MNGNKKKMKIAIKYLRLPPIYITSKQDNNLLLADRKPNGAYGRKAEYHNLITNHVAWKLQYIQGGNNYGKQRKHSKDDESAGSV